MTDGPTLVELVNGLPVMSDAEECVVRYAASLAPEDREWFLLSVKQTEGAASADALRAAVERGAADKLDADARAMGEGA